MTVCIHVYMYVHFPTAREVQQYVVGLVDKEGRTVGYPSELESRKHLVLANGNVMVASHKLYYERKKKVSF